jgi:hypothetical protein
MMLMQKRPVFYTYTANLLLSYKYTLLVFHVALFDREVLTLTITARFDAN